MSKQFPAVAEVTVGSNIGPVLPPPARGQLRRDWEGLFSQLPANGDWCVLTPDVTQKGHFVSNNRAVARNHRVELVWRSPNVYARRIMNG